MQLARILKALADPARLQLLTLIRSAGEACACDLTEPVGLSQPTVSHHLKVLTPRDSSTGGSGGSGPGSAPMTTHYGTWAAYSVDDGQYRLPGVSGDPEFEANAHRRQHPHHPLTHV